MLLHFHSRLLTNLTVISYVIMYLANFGGSWSFRSNWDFFHSCRTEWVAEYL